MKKTIITMMTIATAVITACNTKPAADPQSSPRAVAETIFYAAKNDQYDALAALIDDEADGDSKRIAQAATDQGVQAEFRKYFSNARVSAEPVIADEKASVNILFGPDGTKEETFEMIRKNGKWYLHSF